MEKVMNEKIIMNYEVVELLHKSSSWGNIVFKVKPQNKEKLYVLKCFPKIENGLQKLIFKREIEALRTLNVCEGIVKLRDSSTELYPFKENECYGGILMDYVPGETLDHINWNKYTQLKKYEICLQILKAVNNAHSNNVIHRDLKPSNIIYDKYADKVTLIDFGTSKIKTVMDSETTMPLYSEGYSAPELILGKNITEKCDYYSIGIIMSEILLSQKNGSDINSRIEEWTGRKEIKDILLSLVQEKPENRPESLENVIVILERLIGNLNTSSCSYSLILEKEESQPYPWVCNWHDLENIIEILKYLNKEPEDFIDYIIWRIESHPNVLSSDELNVIEGYFMNSQARKQNGAIFFPANGPSLIDKIYFEKHAIPYEYPVATTVVRKKKKIGRNEPCPCGSGKKFKKCCIEKGIYD
ncbi:protein kinase domain-containing protein [[Ruminococcus] torques]|uniref:protein kinase domain-containing protein n=1 Tax=[Ruminococcus] torques TaxID=33039 RepID=UPI00210C1AA3|nr:protein kinase [[Ruminococcus] torques]MCB5922718.1 protein kinase [Faecalicatena fissicatena]MCC2814382.1 protein kinase [Faecalicatena fissicatena]MCQ5274693.1 protein kinase [[Ruminococcus] torques]MCQ5345047.1 protein kinase [[Ruminococcus] torques]